MMGRRAVGQKPPSLITVLETVRQQLMHHLIQPRIQFSAQSKYQKNLFFITVPSIRGILMQFIVILSP